MTAIKFNIKKTPRWSVGKWQQQHIDDSHCNDESVLIPLTKKQVVGAYREASKTRRQVMKSQLRTLRELGVCDEKAYRKRMTGGKHDITTPFAYLLAEVTQYGTVDTNSYEFSQVSRYIKHVDQLLA